MCLAWPGPALGRPGSLSSQEGRVLQACAAGGPPAAPQSVGARGAGVRGIRSPDPQPGARPGGRLGRSGAAGWVLVTGRAGGGRRGGGEAHARQARGVGGRVLSCEALSADGAAVVLCGNRGERGAVQRWAGRGGSRAGPPLTCSSQGTMQPSWKRWLQGSCRTRSPNP